MFQPFIALYIKKVGINELAFFDLSVRKGEMGSLDVAVYKRPTSTMKVIPSDSEHPFYGP